MENATKFLLIAAAALIVILLIAFALSIKNSTSEVGGTTERLGAGLEESTGSATTEIIDSLTLQGLIQREEEGEGAGD